MSADAPIIPPVRDDLRIMASRDGLTVEDPVRRVRLRLGPQGAAAFNAAAAANATPASVQEAIPDVSPARLREHLQFAVHEHLFETPRWQDQRALYHEALAVPYPSPAELPLRWRDDLRHECVACGSSCQGTDIGPVPDATVTAVEEHKLWHAVSGATRTGDLFQEVTYKGESMRVLARARDRCALLDANNLCGVHAAAGPAAKPGVCRQFPFVLVRARDAVYASLAMECRSFLQARQAGKATRPDAFEGFLRGLLTSGGAMVTDVPDPVPLAPGLVIGTDEYTVLEEDLLGAISRAPPDADPLALWTTSMAAVVALVEKRAEAYTAQEPYLEARLWGGDGEPDGDNAGEQPERAMQSMLSALAAGTSTNESDALRTGNLLRAERASLFQKALLVLAGELPMRRPAWNGVEGPGVLRTALIADIWGKEPLRRDDLLRGMAELGLKLRLTQAMARFRAFQASRLPMTGQDAVDALVAVCKMLREPFVKKTLAGSAGMLRWQFGAPDAPRHRSWMGSDLSS